MDEEREARMPLAALSEPGDTITGTLVARLGAAETVRLITSGVQLPNGVDPAEGELWRRRLAPRIGRGHTTAMQSFRCADHRPVFVASRYIRWHQ